MSAIGGEADESRPTCLKGAKLFGLRIFAPPFGPPDFMGGTSGLHDDPLICGTEWLGEAAQRGLDEPRLYGDPRSLVVRIELPGHSQRPEGRCDAPGRHHYMHDSADLRLACTLALSGFLDHGQGCTGCGIVAFQRAFCELEKEGLGRRHTALGSVFADFHYLA
jgi:hypothetical protein